MYSPRTGGAYLGLRPAKKKVQSFCRRVNEVAAGVPTFAREEALIYQVNNVLRGWVNYFQHGTLSPAYNVVHRHACYRVRQWLMRKQSDSFEGWQQTVGGEDGTWVDRLMGEDDIGLSAAAWHFGGVRPRPLSRDRPVLALL